MEKPLILLVDDNSQNLQVLGNLLEETYKTAVAENGVEALEFVKKKLPDLVLLDIVMLDMDGFEVCQRLKADPETRDIPVIFLTALTETEDIVKGFALGSVDYVTKPFRQEELLARVKTHVTLRNSQKRVEEQNLQLQREISERKRAEEALQKAHDELEFRVEERTVELRLANTELAKALRLKDEFLATMNHELRTPLHIILGMSASLREDVYGTLQERQDKSIAMIAENGQHLLALINDVLEFAQLSAGKLQLVITPVDVDAVRSASLHLIKPLAQKKRLKILTSCISLYDAPTIQADERRVKQMLVNLLNNAVKFTPEGGTIGLEVEADAEQRVMHFTVWDTGIGIAQEDLDRLFQPFMQLDSSLSRKYEGTGLGLVLVESMVKLHGGRISVESEIGKGSRFTMTLPWENWSRSNQSPVQEVPFL